MGGGVSFEVTPEKERSILFTTSVSVRAGLPQACPVNGICLVRLPSPVWDMPHPFLPTFLSERSCTPPFPESCYLPPKQEQIHPGRGQAARGPTGWGTVCLERAGCGVFADSNLGRNCGLRPAGLAIPSGWPVDPGRLNTGFLVLLTLPLPWGASESWRQGTLLASGQESTQDAAQPSASPPSTGFLLRAAWACWAVV